MPHPEGRWASAPSGARSGALAKPVICLVAVLALAAGQAGAAPALRPPGWVVESPAPARALRPIGDALLFAELEAGDRSWQPTGQIVGDGRVRWSYRLRPGEPPLTLQQILWRLRNPPSWEKERQSIRQLLARLRGLGVQVVVGPTRQPLASGEWEPRLARLRIRPDVPSQGSLTFAQVLNHEAIHVAQSCRGGNVRSAPVPLGLPILLAAEARRLLALPVYAAASPAVRQLEAEAFAHQEDLTAGAGLLERWCPARPGRLAP